jgi:ribonuclease D
MAIDTETTGRDIRDGRGYCVGISAAVRVSDVYYYSYFPVAHHEDNIDSGAKELLYQVISSRARIIFHNAKFDIESLETAGYRGGFIKWYCTMMMAHFLNENVPKDLDSLSRRLLGSTGKVKKDYTGIWSMGLGHMIPVAEIEEYAGVDTLRTLQLFYKMYPYFVKSGFDGDQVSEV